MKLTINILLLISTTSAIIIENSTSDYLNRIINATGRILQSCQLGTSNILVNLVNLDPEFTAAMFKIPNLTFLTSRPTFQTPEKILTSKSDQKHPYKPQYTILNTCGRSQTSLNNLLNFLKSTKWWKLTLRLILVESKLDCRQVSKTFQLIESYGILNTIYLKYMQHQHKLAILTMNKYGREPPPNWKRHATFIKPISPIFSLYEPEINYSCDQTFFEKVTNLNNYTIHANAKNMPPFLTINSIPKEAVRTAASFYHATLTQDDKNKFADGFDHSVHTTIIKRLNATMNIKVYIDNSSLGFVDENFTVHGMLADHVRAEEPTEIGINTHYSRTKGHIPILYPFGIEYMTVITKHRGFSHLPFINHGLSIVFLNSIAFFITVAFLAVITGKSLTHCTHYIFGILIGHGVFKHERTNLTIRVYLGWILVISFVISSGIQSYMTSILSFHHSKKNIDTLNEVRASIKRIYGGENYLRFVKTDFNLDIQEATDDDCINRVLDDLQAACVHNTVFAKYQRNKHKGKLKVLKEPLMTLFLTYTVKPDWPLAERYGSLIGRLREAGILKMWLSNVEESENLRRLRKRDRRKFEKMPLKEILDFFLALIIGLSVATIVFGIEHIVYRMNLRFPNHFFVKMHREMHCLNLKKFTQFND